jgi:hypothetical protein
VAAVKHARVIVVAGLVLAIGWVFAPRSAPPLYDGVGFPDEPYRFVVKPQGASDTKAPTIATGNADVIRGQAGAVHANSAELAPQVSFLIPVNRLRAPTGTTRIVVQGRPVTPIAAADGAYLWSNVYDIEATPGSTTFADGDPPATLTLRAATAQRPYPSIERYTGSSWVKVKTVPVGNDIYQSTLPALGRYAVIGSKPLDVTQLNKGGGQTTTHTGLFIAGAAVLVIIVLIIIGVRRRRELSRAPDD